MYWSKADESFIAEVPELLGCAADGKTYGEALHSLEITIAGSVYAATLLGRNAPEPAASFPSPETVSLSLVST